MMSIDNKLYRRVLFIGPHLDNRGGISAVLNAYKRNLPEFHMLATNSVKGTVAGLFNFARTLIALPFAKWFGGFDTIDIHASTGKSWKRKSKIVSLAKALGFKTVLHMHSGNFRNTVEKEGVEKFKKTLAKCDRVLFLTPKWHEYARETFGLNNLGILNNIIDTPAVGRPEPERELNGLRRFVYLGWFIPEKGIYDLLDVVSENAGYFRGKATVVFGGRYNEETVQQKIRELGIEDIIDYRGWIWAEEKDRLLKESHVLILPSYIEGLPISLLEAMTYSMPVITTDVGGIPEIVTDKVNGIMFKPRDKNALFEAMKHYMETPEDIVKHGRNGHEVSKNFAPEIVCSRLNEIISEVRND